MIFKDSLVASETSWIPQTPFSGNRRHKPPAASEGQGEHGKNLEQGDRTSVMDTKHLWRGILAVGSILRQQMDGKHFFEDVSVH